MLFASLLGDGAHHAVPVALVHSHRGLRAFVEGVAEGRVAMPLGEFARDVLARTVGQVDRIARECRQNTAKGVEHKAETVLGGGQRSRPGR